METISVPFYVLFPVVGVGVIQGLQQAITENKASGTVSILSETVLKQQ